jgi:DNA-binding transcriptional LysR family regulator
MPLLDRSGRKRIKLTSVGEVVYNHAIKILSERDNMRAEIDELCGLKKGSLKIGIPSMGIVSGFFVHLYAEFKISHPEINVQFFENDPKQMEEKLLSGETEINIALRPNSKKFEYQDICSDSLVIFLPENHELAHHDYVNITDLRTTPLILLEEPFLTNRAVVEACQKSGFEPNVVTRTNQVNLIIDLVAEGLGVAFLPRILYERQHPGIKGLPLKGMDTDWNLAIVWLSGANLSHAAKALLSLASKNIKSHGVAPQSKEHRKAHKKN